MAAKIGTSFSHDADHGGRLSRLAIENYIPWLSRAHRNQGRDQQLMLNISCYQGVDRWSRNARLYKSLCDIGLVVVPVYTADNTGRIDALYVTAGLPTELALTAETTAGWQSRRAHNPVRQPQSRMDAVADPATASAGQIKQSDTVVPFRRR